MCPVDPSLHREAIATRPWLGAVAEGTDTNGEFHNTPAQWIAARETAILAPCDTGRAMERRPMYEVVYYLIYWPVSIAVGGWLFFEIARRM